MPEWGKSQESVTVSKEKWVPNGYRPFHRDCTSGYVATREHSTWKAGAADAPCKHRAFLIAYVEIREPHVRREWAQLNRERPIRKAVA